MLPYILVGVLLHKLTASEVSNEVHLQL